MVSTFLVVAFFIGSAFGSPEIANQYVDTVLNTAVRELNKAGLNQVTLPGYVTKVRQYTWNLGNVQLEAQFPRGNLSGLDQVRRYSECQGPYYAFGTKRVNCTIGFDRLQFTYEGTLKVENEAKVDIKGTTNLTYTHVFMEVSNGRLNSFLTPQVGDFKPKFSDIGSLNKYTEFLELDFKVNVRNAAFNYITQKAFKDALVAAVSSVPMPN